MAGEASGKHFKTMRKSNPVAPQIVSRSRFRESPADEIERALKLLSFTACIILMWEFLMSLFRNWIAFRRNARGSMSITFVFSLIPALLFISAAIDYGMAVNAKAKVRAAADFAIMAAVNPSVLLMGSEDVSLIAQNAFKASLGSINGVTNAKINVNITESGTKRTATIDYSANVVALFGAFMGATELTIRGTVVASNSRRTYIDFYLVLDNSPSMGIAGTKADIDLLTAKTGGCAFACHLGDTTSDTYTIARQNGVTLRIDTVRLATRALMDKAKATRQVPDQFRMALYSFGASADLFGLKKCSH